MRFPKQSSVESNSGIFYFISDDDFRVNIIVVEQITRKRILQSVTYYYKPTYIIDLFTGSGFVSFL